MSFRLFKHPANAIPPILALVAACIFGLHLHYKGLAKENIALRKENAILLEERAVLIEIATKQQEMNDRLIGLAYNEIIGLNGARAPVIEESNGDF